MAGRPWVVLAYRLPRDPSTPRIAVWKRLRRLGVAQPLDGLALLPETPANREALEWVADRVVQADGQATLWTARHDSLRDEQATVDAMTAAVQAEYEAVVAQADEARAAALSASPGGDAAAGLRRAAGRLGEQLAEVQARDHFGAPGRVQAQDAVTGLLAAARTSGREPAR